MNVNKMTSSLGYFYFFILGHQVRRNGIDGKAPLKSRAFSSLIVSLLGNDVGRTWPFSALSDLEFDLLALVEGGVTCRLDL